MATPKRVCVVGSGNWYVALCFFLISIVCASVRLQAHGGLSAKPSVSSSCTLIYPALHKTELCQTASHKFKRRVIF